MTFRILIWQSCRETVDRTASNFCTLYEKLEFFLFFSEKNCFFWNWSSGHVKCSFCNPAQSSLPERPKLFNFLNYCTKEMNKKLSLHRKYFWKRSPEHVESSLQMQRWALSTKRKSFAQFPKATIYTTFPEKKLSKVSAGHKGCTSENSCKFFVLLFFFAKKPKILPHYSRKITNFCFHKRICSSSTKRSTGHVDCYFQKAAKSF